MRSALLTLAAFFLPLIVSAGDSSAILGSPDFRPTPEHPFGWRGDGSGRFPGATPVTEWSATKNVRWSVVVGRSYASPILTEKYVIVLSEPDVLICLNRTDGKEAWKIKTSPADLTDEKERAAATEYKAKETGLAGATPITDGTNVYIIFANGIVRAVDLSGKPKWIAYIDAQESTAYGRCASPILVAGKLIVQMTNLYAFDPATGKQLWVNTESKTTYGTPAGMKVNATDLIVTPAGDVVRADTGKAVNSGLGPGFHTSPMTVNDIVYIGDHEFRATKLDSAFKDKDEWSGEITGDIFCSPLLHNDLFFTVAAAGELSVFDLKSKGEAKPLLESRPLFGEPTPGSAPIAYASLTLGGKFMFLNSNKGDIVVLDPTREAKQLAKNKLKDGSGATPVFSGKDMFLRDGDKLYCIGE